MTEKPVRIALVAGEISGDLLASNLIHALKRRFPTAIFYGVGGYKMLAEGFQTWYPLEKLAVCGLFEVIKHYRALSAMRKDILRRLLSDPPDVFIGVDAPDFNLGLEKALKRRGIPTIHYVSPTIWAWRKKRINTIAAAVSHILVLFPFEAALYEKRRVPATYVGHPLADILPLADGRISARELLNVPQQRPVFAFLPGSRQSELEFMAGTFIATAREIYSKLPDALFLVPLITRETRLLFETALYEHTATDLPFRLLFGHAHEAMMAADVVLLTSGTAALEAALLKRPMVIAYKLSPSTSYVIRKLTYLPYFGLPNILAGKFLVPEFFQEEATHENLAQALLNFYLDKTSVIALAGVFREMHLTLKQNTAEKAADVVSSFLPCVGKVHEKIESAPIGESGEIHASKSRQPDAIEPSTSL